MKLTIWALDNKSEDVSVSVNKTIEEYTNQLLQLQTTLDHVGAYVFTKDLQGRYTYANQMVCDLFGLTLDDIIGRTDDEFFNLESYNEISVNDRQVLEQGQQIEREETSRVAKTGEVRTYWTVKSPLRNADGDITGMCGISTDITERLKMEEALREQKVLLDTVLNNADSYIYMKDQQCRFLYANSNVAKLFNLSQQDIIGKHGSEILPAEVAKNFDILDRQVIESGEKMYGEENFFEDDGSIRHYWSVKIPLKKKDQEKVYAFVGISTDITEIVRLKEDFKTLANTDSLTGIYSRRCLMECAKRELQRVQRHTSALTVVIFDIDNFKTINDNFGHATGDNTIVLIVNACKKILREIDIFGRLGGDEFVVITPDTSLTDALAITERLRLAVHNIIPDPDNPVKISCSFGVATWKGEQFFDELLFRADAALYNAKQSGRDCVKYRE
ncbi:diguanylate cyclase [Neptunicella sp. SCSIO 80796]|uniref:sensor domain-containing diguanylate cyclase n=1 Tax=Neptunicella plasticusilytica TaxID=3117012 RepID=UPI003A4D4E55